MQLTALPRSVPRLRMAGDVPQLPLHFMTRWLIKYRANFAAFGMDGCWFGLWELHLCISSRHCVQSNSRTKGLQWALDAFLFCIKADWSLVWYWPSCNEELTIVTPTLTNYVCLILSGFVCFQWNLNQTSIFMLLNNHICRNPVGLETWSEHETIRIMNGDVDNQR